MRIRVHSDLHEEFRHKYPPLALPHVAADVTVLAGDIANGLDVVEIARRPCFAGSVKLIVPGNHEFYNGCVSTLRAGLQRAVRKLPDVFVLDDRCQIVHGVRFAGATLWTDFGLYGAAGELIARDHVEATMPDYRLIEIEPGVTLTVAATKAMHAASREFLAQTLAQPFDGPTVVVTHHAPHPNSIAERFAGNPVNPAFVSDLGALVERCDLWIHGHTHNSFDYRVGGARVFANPAGYRKRIGEEPERSVVFENPVFDPACVVAIRAPSRPGGAGRQPPSVR